MQIEVVDDCSTKDDPEAVVDKLGRGRVETPHRQPHNVGITRNFNTCLRRSRGHLVHILHGDDLVKRGFYQEIEEQAEQFPQAAMLATCSWYVDEEGQAFDSSPFVERSPSAAPGMPSRCITAIRCARRRWSFGGAFTKSMGGSVSAFRTLPIGKCRWRERRPGGAVMSDAPLACYREFSRNDTSRLRRTAENLREMLHLGNVFLRHDHRFDAIRFRRWIRMLAEDQLAQFPSGRRCRGRGGQPPAVHRAALRSSFRSVGV